MMKRIFALLSLSFLAISCNPTVEPEEESQMVVYLIDYGSNEFEAGTVLNFRKANVSFSTLDIDIDLDPIENGDAGAVSLIFDPTGDKIFEGSLNIEGSAAISFPGLTAGDSYFRIDNAVALPAAGVQDIDGPYSESIGPIWNSIDQLGITEIFVNNDALLGRFLYRPNNSNTENWKWVFLLFDQ